MILVHDRWAGDVSLPAMVYQIDLGGVRIFCQYRPICNGRAYWCLVERLHILRIGRAHIERFDAVPVAEQAVIGCWIGNPAHPLLFSKVDFPCHRKPASNEGSIGWTDRHRSSLLSGKGV